MQRNVNFRWEIEIQQIFFVFLKEVGSNVEIVNDDSSSFIKYALSYMESAGKTWIQFLHTIYLKNVYKLNISNRSYI